MGIGVEREALFLVSWGLEPGPQNLKIQFLGCSPFLSFIGCHFFPVFGDLFFVEKLKAGGWDVLQWCFPQRKRDWERELG